MEPGHERKGGSREAKTIGIGCDDAAFELKGVFVEHLPDEGSEKTNNATVEGLGTLPPALKLVGSLGLGEEQLPLLHHLYARLLR